MGDYDSSLALSRIVFRLTHDFAKAWCCAMLSQSNKAHMLLGFSISTPQYTRWGPPGAVVTSSHASFNIWPAGVDGSMGVLPGCTPIVPTSTTAMLGVGAVSDKMWDCNGFGGCFPV